MSDRIHPEERRPLEAYQNGGRRKQPVAPNRPARLRAWAEQATTEQLRELLLEIARFCDAGEEDMEGLMVTLFGAEK